MTEVLFSNLPIGTKEVSHSLGLEDVDIQGLSCKPKTLSPYTPYLIGNSQPKDLSIIQELSKPGAGNELTQLFLSLGPENTTALAEITTLLKDYNIGLVGSSTSVYGGRMEAFGKAIQEYQKALIAYRDVYKSNSSAKILAKNRVISAFQHLQQKFRHELNAVTADIKARRGTPYNNVNRAMNMAKHNRNITKLQINNQVQARNLVKFSQHAKYLGNGLAVIDFSSRIGNIHNSYQSGGNWERELFVESLSFTASTVTGIAAVNTGLALLLMATPVGWVGLVVGGIAIAGTAAAASMAVNNTFKDNSGAWYDQIMSWIR